MASMLTAPTAGEQRLLHLDVLRGFALFGILLVNFELFTTPVQAFMLGIRPELDGLDLVADWLVMAFAEAKFYPLFSMLFGMGFALMLDRARRSDRPFWGLYLRRLGVLFLIGLAHMLLIWSGDVLMVYAVAGFLMVLLFRHTPTERLPGWAVFLLALPLLLNWLGTSTMQSIESELETESVVAEQAFAENTWLAETERVAEVYSKGGYFDAVQQRLDDLLYLVDLDLIMLPLVLGFFLLGRWLLESDRLHDPSAHPRFFRALRRWGLAGLALSLVGTWLRYGSTYTELSYALAFADTVFTIGGVLLALGYLALVVGNAQRLAWLAPAGQMALTNYLLQSLCWTWVFYGYGLGLWGQIPKFGQVLSAIGFFGLQVVFSHWWLARFRFGPAEWLWRSLTYLRAQPIRRAA